MRRNDKISTLLLALGLIAASAATAQTPKPSAPILVELFTSEGCSSCPPADALLQQLNSQQIVSGRRVVVLSEHVTYWNQLGWQDPYSASIFTERQTQYGQRLHLDDVYTPQMVVDGVQQFVGSDRGAALHAIGSQSPAHDFLHLTATHAGPTSVDVTYSYDGPASRSGAKLMAVIADDMDETQVQRGENEGRTLKHVSVARSLVPVATLNAPATGQTVAIALPSPARLGHHRHLVLFVQGPNLGPVLGVDMAPID